MNAKPLAIQNNNTSTNFIHLRAHSAYSLAQGAIKIKDLIAHCKEKEIPAIALTDSNNLFGSFEFSSTAVKNKIQPIIGIQINLYDKIVESLYIKNKETIFYPSIILLVKNQQGYDNLKKLSSISYLQSASDLVNAISLEDLQKYNQGLICLTGGNDGPLGILSSHKKENDVTELTKKLLHIFENNLYIELQRHGHENERYIEKKLLKLAYEHNIPLVATNNIFFLSPHTYKAHDALLCISQQKNIIQDDRIRVTDNHYFKSSQEMSELFKDIPEAIQNTVKIAQRCGHQIPYSQPLLPKYISVDGLNENDELIKQAKLGLEKRLIIPPYNEMSIAEKDAYYQRLDFELNVIIKMNFSGYFLIVSDFIKWSKENDIPVGPGRGSGVGSIVAWGLSITALDPLKYGLLFERFLNPERVSMPDFDIDFCPERREDVIKYVQHKYGQKQVAQIITFGKLQAKAVVRDVGRTLNIPYPQVDRISKLIPNNPANPCTLEEAIQQEARLRNEIRENDDIRNLIELSKELEGLYRHASTHAAGLVIGDRPLDELVALYKDPKSDTNVTQFNMKFIEQTGLIKFDFLGLTTLTIIKETLRLIKKLYDIDINIDTIDLEDSKVFELLSEGKSNGVFQLESSGMRDVLKKMKPSRLEDLMAVVSLYRPGPMDQIPLYIKRKHGESEKNKTNFSKVDDIEGKHDESKVDYMHPLLKDILSETYGIIIYQEQIMQIAQVLAGYSLGSADILRRAMGKKIKEEMEQQQDIFINGAVKNKVERRQAEEIFEKVSKFASYGFNKSHAAAYSLIAYQTAWLKTHYCIEFICSIMTLSISNIDRLESFIQEAKNFNIEILPPDINKSDVLFTVEFDSADKKIRYALSAIKNIGQGVTQQIISERKQNGVFRSIEDFLERVDSKALNRKSMENLIDAGAFDSLEINRSKLHANLDNMILYANSTSHEKSTGQENLFVNGRNNSSVKEAQSSEILYKVANPLDEEDKLEREKNAIGFYLSKHPLELFADRIREYGATYYRNISEEGAVKLVGICISVRERTSRKGDRYAYIQVSDKNHKYEVFLFSDTLEQYRNILTKGTKILIHATVRKSDGSWRITANSIKELTANIKYNKDKITLKINTHEALESLTENVDNQSFGKTCIFLLVKVEQTIAKIKLPRKYNISNEFLSFLENESNITWIK